MAQKKASEEPAGKARADLGFGGIFEGIEKLITAASKLSEAAGGTQKTAEFSIPGLGDKAKGIFGFSIRTMGAGHDQVEVEPFGNIRTTREGPVVEEVREPIVDTFDEGDEIRVLAEMPGVDEADVHYQVNGDILTLSAQNGRRYHKEVLLPAAVKDQDATATYKNGIFELRLAKA